MIGLNKDWLDAPLKKAQKEQLAKINFLDFIPVQTEAEYMELLNNYIKESGETLDLTHNYSLTAALLNQVAINYNIKQLVMNQNFQIYLKLITKIASYYHNNASV